MGHRQVWVKVNASIDEGVAPLVSALAEFPGVCTASSCQGDAPHGEEAVASVVFTYSPSDPRETMRIEGRPLPMAPAQFGAWLGQELLVVVADDAELSVSYSHNPPLLTLAVRKTAVQGVADVLRQIASRQVRFAA